MPEKHLGPGFEVHGGGLDLRFPHHENELAQSRGGGRPFARTSMHNGLIELGAERTSKSIGNIVSLREAVPIRSPGPGASGVRCQITGAGVRGIASHGAGSWP